MTTTPKNRVIVTVEDDRHARRCARGRVVLIDDDADILDAFAAIIEMEGYACESYASAKAYLEMLNFNRPCFPGPNCVLCDIRMPEVDGLELQNRLKALDGGPMVLMSGSSGALEAASAFRAGAVDFLIKPVEAEALLAAVAKALAVSAERQRAQLNRAGLAARVETLTTRESEVVRRVCAGKTNPDIATELGIALRTVKLHRQRAMEKLGAESVTELVRRVDEWNSWT